MNNQFINNSYIIYNNHRIINTNIRFLNNNCFEDLDFNYNNNFLLKIYFGDNNEIIINRNIRLINGLFSIILNIINNNFNLNEILYPFQSIKIYDNHNEIANIKYFELHNNNLLIEITNPI